MYNSVKTTFYTLFVSLIVIFYLVNLKKFKTIKLNLFTKANVKFPVTDFFENSTNASGIPHEERFDVVSVLNSVIQFPTFSNESDFTNIYILGLFELTSKWGVYNEGKNALEAAQLAVKHVNALKMLTGYKLVLLVNDTECDPGVAIDRFFHTIYSNQTILMLLGSGCSNVSEALAHIVPYWNIIQVSYGSLSPTLSNRDKFPLFFRTAAPESSHNIAKTDFIKYHKWQLVVAFSQSENQYLLPVNHLITELERENVSCLSTVTFSRENYREQLEVLKSLDVRIIIGSFSAALAPFIFCAAYALNMYGSEYVWIMENIQPSHWWKQPFNTACNQAVLEQTVEGIVMISDHYYSKLEWFNKSSPLWTLTQGKFSRQTYDAVWAMALCLLESNIEPLEEFDYDNQKVAQNFYASMERLDFVGISGPVKFKGADRVGDYVIKQIQEGIPRPVALYDSIKGKLVFDCQFCENLLWANGHIPIAQRIIRTTLVIMPSSLFYLTSCISVMGISCSLVFLYFNLKFRHMRTIKLSSPNLNNLSMIGCILVYCAVILFGLPHFVQRAYFNKLCLGRIYLLSAGFSLTFGSMFAKSYRVHRLFTCPTSSLVKYKLLKDRQLIAIILIPLLIDSLILSLWISVDPLQRSVEDLTLEPSSDDPRILNQLQVELCQCHNTVGWHIALFGYKFIMLILGVYMAWKTRHVKIPSLNDSHYIGICVYCATFCILLVIAFSFVQDYFVLSYIVKTGSILTTTTITFALMFLPKIKTKFGTVDNEVRVLESLGLKIEANTRRFINDDPMEVYSRLEIQNNVFRSEIASLDREIARLEALLREPSVKVPIYPEVYLQLPRRSWPVCESQPMKTFSSENKLNKTFFGKLKKVFGSPNYSDNNLSNESVDSNPECSTKRS